MMSDHKTLRRRLAASSVWESEANLSKFSTKIQVKRIEGNKLERTERMKEQRKEEGTLVQLCTNVNSIK